MDEVENRLHKMLTSGDLDMRKIGQKLCHELRISYYMTYFYHKEWVKWYSIKSPIIKYTRLDKVNEITFENQSDYLYTGIKICKINLKDSNGTAKIKQKHSQTTPNVWKEAV